MSPGPVKIVKSAAARDPFGNVSVTMFLSRRATDGEGAWNGCVARREPADMWDGILGKLGILEPAKGFELSDIGLNGFEGPVSNIYKVLLVRDARGWLDRLLHRRLTDAETFLIENQKSREFTYQTDYGMEGLFSIPTGKWFVGRNLSGKKPWKGKRIIY